MYRRLAVLTSLLFCLCAGQALAASPVPNDTWQNATEIPAAPWSISEDATGAQTEDLVSDSTDVWFRYQPAESGPVEINTFGSDYDTRLAIYRDENGPSALVLVASDTFGPQSSTYGNDTWLYANETYLIEVEAQPSPLSSDAVPSGHLHLQVGPPASDSIATPDELTIDGPATGVVTWGATQDSSDPGCAANAQTTWHVLRPATTGWVTVDTFGSPDVAPDLAAYDSSSGGLTEVTCSDDSGLGQGTRLRFPVVAGHTYLVATLASMPGLTELRARTSPALADMGLGLSVSKLGRVTSDGVATFAATVSCARTVDVMLYGSLLQQFGSPDRPKSQVMGVPGETFPIVHCIAPSVSYTFRETSISPQVFQPGGDATLTFSAYGCSEWDCSASPETEQAVHLIAGGR